MTFFRYFMESVCFFFINSIDKETIYRKGDLWRPPTNEKNCSQHSSYFRAIQLRKVCNISECVTVVTFTVKTIIQLSGAFSTNITLCNAANNWVQSRIMSVWKKRLCTLTLHLLQIVSVVKLWQACKYGKFYTSAFWNTI